MAANDSMINSRPRAHTCWPVVARGTGVLMFLHMESVSYRSCSRTQNPMPRVVASPRMYSNCATESGPATLPPQTMQSEALR